RIRPPPPPARRPARHPSTRVLIRRRPFPTVAVSESPPLLIHRPAAAPSLTPLPTAARAAAQPAEVGMTTDQVIVSVSGVRGVVGRGLTPDVALRFAAALGTHVGGGPVVLTRDSRPTGAMLAGAAAAGLMAAGCRVIDGGIA